MPRLDVYIGVCMHIYVCCTYIKTDVCKCVHMCDIFMCICVRVYAHRAFCIFAHMQVCLCVCVYACVCCANVHMHVSGYAYIFAYAYMYE